MSEWGMFAIGMCVGIIVGGWLAWSVCRIRFCAWMSEGWGILAHIAREQPVTADHVAAVFGGDTLRGRPL